MSCAALINTQQFKNLEAMQEKQINTPFLDFNMSLRLSVKKNKHQLDIKGFDKNWHGNAANWNKMNHLSIKSLKHFFHGFIF